MVQKFDELPDLIILKIYSKLEIHDAFTMYDVNQRCRAVLLLDLRLNNKILSRIFIRNLDGDNKMTLVCKKNVLGVKIEGFRFILRFLRAFWKEITLISLESSFIRECWQKTVFKYIVKYRRDQLKNLSISYFSADLDFPIPPFNNIIFLRFNSCHFFNCFSHISVSFPNVKHIKFVNNNVFEDQALRNIIVCKYPKLLYMKMSTLSFTKYQYSIIRVMNPHVFFGFHN